MIKSARTLSQAAAALTAFTLVVLVLSPQVHSPQPAAAVGPATFVSSSGQFSNPSRDPESSGNTLAMFCIRYATDTPVDAVGSAASIQSTDPGATNEIRFGRVPTTASTCYPDARDSSGFIFTGQTAPEIVDDYFVLARFSHSNQQIERGANHATLSTEITFRDPESGALVTTNPVYTISLDETQDGTVNPIPGYPTVAQCQYDVPENYQETLSGILVNRCADRITISQDAPVSFSLGRTVSSLVDISGFASVDPITNECDASTATADSSGFTRENSVTEFCLLARIAPGSIAVETTLDNVDDQSFDYRTVEVDQSSATLAATSNVHDISVATAAGAGTASVTTAEPGLYTIADLTSGLAANVTASSFSCTTSGDTATLALSGTEYLALDSGETITCAIRYSAPASVSASTLPPTGGAAPPLAVASWALILVLVGAAVYQGATLRIRSDDVR